MTRFGLQIPNFSFGVPEAALFDRVVEIATAAEDAGFDSVWVMDHLYQLPALGGSSQPMLEAYSLLAALAARTSRVELGTLVTGVTYRNPAFLAKTVTTLDVISEGRAWLGLGAAWHDIEHEAFGYDFPSAGARLDRLEEAVQICRAMFTQASSTYNGSHYRTKDIVNIPRPVRPGGIPIMIGGGGEKRTLKLVAQYADMCNFFGDAETFRTKVAILHEHCAAVGRDPSEVTVSRLATLMLTDSQDQTDTIRTQIGNLTTAFQVGQDEEVADQINELKGAGVEYFIFNMPLSDVAGVTRAGKLFSTLRG